ncbi:hypothetical protein BBO99_00006389 [Phytophthora kernoviae]|uniref:Uncharacterized protein n=2 Tax=Phytophthora kernoviae TaxID=325452 RepID=A0A3R7HGP8_9STRA|nr:hypothetical protein G195_007272 [Phytophthora kernoviae 00238/432]KAG2516721.1 hypothetical protein JM16_007588 [Phytophthora kernoviae]KAG2519301.1 hypothetical protein JM18_007595 [Phytophthora kernoviae]RLN26547.1 hypothetical protein BBI17_006420 [Phytophthora kernoviae]RLN77909.1 hypothetical protein BBO99_00006389 [Phytophthora kernoviae]
MLPWAPAKVPMPSDSVHAGGFEVQAPAPAHIRTRVQLFVLVSGAIEVWDVSEFEAHQNCVLSWKASTVESYVDL